MNVKHQHQEAFNPAGEPILPERLSDRRVLMHHGSWDAEQRETLIPNTVHILEWISREGIDKDTGGIGLGHALNLKENKSERMKLLQTSILIINVYAYVINAFIVWSIKERKQGRISLRLQC